MKNNQRIFGIAFLFALLPLFAGAQGQWGRPQPGLKGKLEGALVDSLSGQPVEFATVVVLKAGTQEQVDGTITDEKGRFKLFVEVGTYDVQLSFLGYQTKVLRNLRLTKRKPDLDLKRIFFTPESLSLEEVTVSAEASTVENRVDKIVYHADKDATNAGGDAADVLRKVPLLSVDLDGNVSLRGSSNLRILINGKPSSMFATSVADALKTIPADQIKSVEVITTPSAKYDGEGSGGIINIITKKKSVEGFTGSVNSSLGTRNNSLSLNLAAAKGRFGLNANGSGFFFLPNDGTWNYNRFDTLGDGQIRHLQQSGTNTASRQGFHGSIGAFYDINAYNSINSSFRINGFNFPREGANNALLDDPARQIVENSLRQSEDDMLIYGFDWTNDYTKKFADQPERELVFAVQLSGNINDRSGSLLQSGNFPYLAIDERYDNDGTNLETTFQLDYTHPFSKKVKLEIGAKSVLRDLESQYRFDTLSAEQRYAIDQSRSDVFNYNQNVYAGYASFNIKVGDNYGLVAGARYERTDIRGEYNSELPAFQNDYANLLPSIIFSRTFKNYSSLKLSYNQRIQRPSLFYINPFTQQSDRNNLQEGNPQLQPEVTHQLELGYNTFVKGVVLSGALYFRHTDDIIESIQTLLEGEPVAVTTFENVGYNNSLGFNFFTSFTIKEIWTLRGNFNVSTYATRSRLEGLNRTNDGLVYNGFFNSSLKLKHGIQADGFIMFNSPRRTLQGTNPSFSMYSIGIRKELFQKKGSIGIRMVTPFHRTKSFNSELEGQGFYQQSLFSIPFRSYGVSFSYRFGKLDFKAQQRKSKIKNDDLKQGGDQQGGSQF